MSKVPYPNSPHPNEVPHVDTHINQHVTLMQEVWDYSNYICNRGPMPSGARVVCSGWKSGAFGDVSPPTKDCPLISDCPNCVDDGDLLEIHIRKEDVIDQLALSKTIDVLRVKTGSAHEHCVRNVHAEIDAILKCAYLGHSTLRATMYSLNRPCRHCAMAIIKAGIKEVYWANTAYDSPEVLEMFDRAGITYGWVNIYEYISQFVR